MRRRRTRLAVVGGQPTAAFAVAADRLGWSVVAAAGPAAEGIAAATGARVRPVADVVERAAEPADVVVVGTDEARRVADARRLTGRGTAVVLIPGRTTPTDLDWVPAAPLVVGDAMQSAPAVQRWFALLDEWSRADAVEHLSIAWSEPGDDVAGTLALSAAGLTVLSARAARLPGPGSIDVTRRSSGLAGLEMQCATERHVVRVEMFPVPTLELDGDPVAIAGSDHPATAFGAADLLRTFAADVAADRAPILGLDYLALASAERDRRAAG